MPYKSEAQRRYFNANREKLEAEGVDVDEWNESSKGKKLPEKKTKKKKASYVRVKVPHGDQHLLHKYIDANEWDHPAGRVEDGEALRAAAIRELLERTGYSGNDEDLEELGMQGEFQEYSIPYDKLTQVADPGERGGYSTSVKLARCWGHKKQSNILTDIIGDPFENKRKQEEEQEKLDKAVARNMRERIARQIAKEKVAGDSSNLSLEKEAVFGLIGGPLGAGLGMRKAKKEGRPVSHGAEEGFLRGMLTGSGAGVGGSLGLLGSSALMRGDSSTTKGVLAALLPLLGAGVGGYAGWRGGKPLVDQIKANRQQLQDYVDESKQKFDNEQEAERVESEIKNLAKAAAWQEKRALNFPTARKIWNVGSSFVTKPRGEGGMFGRVGDAVMDFLKFKSGVDPAQIAGFSAGSVGDLALDPESRNQIFLGQVPDKLWDPKENTGHNIENLWRRGFRGLAAGSVANPYRLAQKVRRRAKTDLDIKNKKTQKALGHNKFDKQRAPDMGDYGWALGKDTAPKGLALLMGYAPGMIMDYGELPGNLRRTAGNLERLTERAEEVVTGEGGIAENLENAAGASRDLVENFDADRAQLVETANRTMDQSGGAVKSIGGAGEALRNLMPHMEEGAKATTGLVNLLERIDKRLSDATSGAANQVDAWGQRADTVGKAIKDWAPKIGLGALGVGTLYSLYQIMESRRKEKEEQRRERQRLLYKQSDSNFLLKEAGIRYFRKQMQAH